MAYQFEDRPQRILLPAKLGFIALTVLIAVVLNLLPWRDVSGLPDWTALVLTFWCIHQPRKIGIGAAWLLGVIMDTANGALLGQHALAYSVLAFAAIAFSRRIRWFPLWPQATHVFLLSRPVLVFRQRGVGATLAGNHLSAADTAAPARIDR